MGLRCRQKSWEHFKNGAFNWDFYRWSYIKLVVTVVTDEFENWVNSKLEHSFCFPNWWDSAARDKTDLLLIFLFGTIWKVSRVNLFEKKAVVAEQIGFLFGSNSRATFGIFRLQTFQCKHPNQWFLSIVLFSYLKTFHWALDGKRHTSS